jgi:lipocalin
VTFSVFNSARDGSTTGRVTAVNFRATIPNPATNPAKVFVGPNFIPSIFRNDANYWIVATGQYRELAGLQSEPPSKDQQYEWAIVTSAEPRTRRTNATSCYSNEGFWYLSRKPFPPNGTVEALDGIATRLGLDTTVLKAVNHTGCDYVTERRDIFSGFFLYELLDRFF